MLAGGRVADARIVDVVRGVGTVVDQDVLDVRRTGQADVAHRLE